jgi:hypothetical protein
MASLLMLFRRRRRNKNKTRRALAQTREARSLHFEFGLPPGQSLQLSGFSRLHLCPGLQQQHFDRATVNCHRLAARAVSAMQNTTIHVSSPSVH